MRPFSRAALLLCALSLSAYGQNTAEPTPGMGWNSWLANDEQFYPSGAWQPTEAYIKQQADALVSTGLAAYGYTLMSVDGGWQQRDGSGNLQGIPAQFPSGMSALAAYVHARGLKFGLYGTPGDPCLTGFPSDYGHEAADAATIGSWGVDYWKYDFCGANNQYASDSSAEAAHLVMGNALAATGRPIAYLINAYYPMAPFTPPYESLVWGRSVGATDIRIGYDSNATGSQNGWWYWKAQNLDWSSFRPYQRKGYWLDPDNLMLQLKEGGPGLGDPTALVSDIEGRSQFNFYAIVAAPLVFGARITDLTANSLATLENSEVIAVDQDAMGLMGWKVSQSACGSATCAVWVRQLSDGWAVGFFNFDPSAAHDVSASWVSFGVGGTAFAMRDLWAHSSLGSSSSGYTATAVPAMGSVVLKLTPPSFGAQGMAGQGIRIQ